ncbi:PilN domain-containing protein [candidate division FCPU426 bacterium]|nr:PilN domain-containing protein [candidate division FCPU426 bacterium]
MVRINLLPPKVRKTKVALRLYTYFIIAGSMVIIVLILLLLNLLAQTKRLDTRIQALQKEELALADKTGPLLELIAQEKKINSLKKIVRDLTREQSVWIKILDEIAGRMQNDMWLTNIGSARQADGRLLLLTLEGEAYNKISVADFLTALENSSLFQNVSLEALTEIQVNRISQVQFKLKMEYAEVLLADKEKAE